VAGSFVRSARPRLSIRTSIEPQEQLRGRRGYVTTIMQKTGFDSDRFTIELQQARPGRRLVP
jgi:hypothetical protein